RRLSFVRNGHLELPAADSDFFTALANVCNSLHWSNMRRKVNICSLGGLKGQLRHVCGILCSVGGFTIGASLPEREKSVDENDNKRGNLYPKAMVFACVLLFLSGF